MHSRPALFATLTHDLLSSSALFLVALNEPLPIFTSKIRELIPAAIFFDKIEEVIRGIDSTVPTTSLIAYNFLSAGAKSGVCPIIAQPISFTTF